MNITFVMPANGRQDFSARLVECLHRQTRDALIVTENSPDGSFASYYAKVNRLLDLVTTPYAMLVDNDDLVVWPTVQKLIAELDAGPWAAAGGRVAGFAVKGNKPYGKITAQTELYSPYDQPQTYSHRDKNHRVVNGFANSWSFYAVHRTKVLKQIWREVADMNLSDLQLHEKFCAMRLLSLGPVFGCNEISYLRQYGTSGVWKYRDDFPMRMMTNNFSVDRDAILDRLDLSEVARSILIAQWADWWEAWLERNYGPRAALRQWGKTRFPKLTARIKHHALTAILAGAK